MFEQTNQDKSKHSIRLHYSSYSLRLGTGKDIDQIKNEYQYHCWLNLDSKETKATSRIAEGKMKIDM